LSSAEATSHWVSSIFSSCSLETQLNVGFG
jgi:hypothetical protein